jgi:hypothetical protein
MKKFWDFVWGIIAIAVMVLAFSLVFSLGCQSPTDPDHHDCTVRQVDRG